MLVLCFLVTQAYTAYIMKVTPPPRVCGISPILYTQTTQLRVGILQNVDVCALQDWLCSTYYFYHWFCIMHLDR